MKQLNEIKRICYLEIYNYPQCCLYNILFIIFNKLFYLNFKIFFDFRKIECSYNNLNLCVNRGEVIKLINFFLEFYVYV